MAVTTGRKVTGYSDISEQVLAEQSIIQAVSRKDIIGTPGTTTVSVYVNKAATIADYVPGTGVALSADDSAYVVVSNLKEKGINEILDGFTVETAPMDMQISRIAAAMGAAAEQVDTDGFAKMVADGTKLVLAAGAKPTVSTIYTDILNLKAALDTAKAPQDNRYLILTPEMQNLLLQKASGVVLDTANGDAIVTNGFTGKVLGFNVFVTTLMPAGTNIIALQDRAFVFGMAWKKDIALVSLDGSSQFYGDSAIKGRWAYVTGAVRPTLIQINQGAA